MQSHARQVGGFYESSWLHAPGRTLELRKEAAGSRRIGVFKAAETSSVEPVLDMGLEF